MLIDKKEITKEIICFYKNIISRHFDVWFSVGDFHVLADMLYLYCFVDIQGKNIFLTNEKIKKKLDMMCKALMNCSEEKFKNEIIKEIKEKSFFPKSSDYNLFLRILTKYHRDFIAEYADVSVVENEDCNIVFISKKLKRQLHIRKLLKD